jgi:PelA/Pel-15E family pectate lyase
MLVVLSAGAFGCALRAQTDASAKLPGAARERDTTSMLSARRLDALPATERVAWTQYIDQSRREQERDKALIDAELRTVGREQLTRAPYEKEAFAVSASMTPTWFRSDSGRRMAAIVLSFQTPSGGWSKHVDMAQRPRLPGESFFSENESWQYIATIDNEATTSQMRFLALADAATPAGDARYRRAFLRALDYLDHAQFPNGCWPQVYPLQGGYHDAATFNDDAAINVLRVLRDAAAGTPAFVPEDARRRAAESITRGVACIVRSQVVVNGARTVWAQQHDALTLAPAPARSYEPASLSGRESASIVAFLMVLPSPKPEVVVAVHAAADWFGRTAIRGYTYDAESGLRHDDGGPIWARMSEIGTNRPIFSNRDGIILYDWNQLTDRREGYAWYSREPAAVLKTYERWAQEHPRR